mmetsp:Transcript_8187/g.18314  ORF Transcript_8187/g.18314 Transcript_8187/m.18314 type:complete len:582 (-) Transcript_8187:97-1842(-)
MTQITTQEASQMLTSSVSIAGAEPQSSFGRCKMLSRRPRAESRSSIPNTKCPETLGCKGWRSVAAAREQESDIIAELFSLLQQLTPARRREIVMSEMSQDERLLLETWILATQRSGQQTRIQKPQLQLPGAVPAVATLEPSVQLEEKRPSTDRIFLKKTNQEKPAVLSASDAPLNAHGAERSSGSCRHGLVLRRSRPITVTKGRSRPTTVTKGFGKQAKVACRQRRYAGGKKTYYQATTCTQSFCFESKEMATQAEAQKALATLMAAKTEILKQSHQDSQSSSATASPGKGFAAIVQAALANALREHSTSQEQLGLKFRVQLHVQGWLRAPLSTPFHSCLTTALQDWEHLEPFTSCSRLVDRITGGSCSSQDHALNAMRVRTLPPPEAEKRWLQFRKAYLAVLEGHGMSRAKAAKRLDQTEAASAEWREGLLQRWNLKRMRAEDPKLCLDRHKAIDANQDACQRAPKPRKRTALQDPKRRQGRDGALTRRKERQQKAQESQSLRREQQAMQQEDSAARTLRKYENARERTLKRLCVSIRRLLAKWRRKKHLMVSSIFVVSPGVGDSTQKRIAPALAKRLKA